MSGDEEESRSCLMKQRTGEGQEPSGGTSRLQSATRPRSVGCPCCSVLSAPSVYFSGQNTVVLKTPTWFSWAGKNPKTGLSFQVTSTSPSVPQTRASGRYFLPDKQGRGTGMGPKHVNREPG